MRRLLFSCVWAAVAATCVFSMGQARLFAGTSETCPRFAEGSVVEEPENLYSHNGVLRVNLAYKSRVDENGNTLFCFVDANGAQSPTLHVRPGDRLIINLKNDISVVPGSASAHAMPGMIISPSESGACGASMMTAESVNIHYHGANVPPTCHQDEVIKTIVNPGETFRYDVHFPKDEPPGLYWYHPHIHGMSEAAVQGGASGAITVEGIENVNSEVGGLPQRLLIIRDNNVPGSVVPDKNELPAWDISLNYVPLPYPHYPPAIIPMKPGEKELWRVLNASADTIIDLQLQYDGEPQSLRVVALDGVPTGSQDGTSKGKSITESDLLLPPAGRAEFIVTGPSAEISDAKLLTLYVPTGPDGDYDPQRNIAKIKLTSDARSAVAVPPVSGPPPPARFAGLDRAKPTALRRLYFSEVLSDPSNPNSPTNFFITVEGAKPKMFSPDDPPAIVTTQGAVEDWTIENRAFENHEFHMHQIHFLVLERDGKPVKNGQYLDTINVPYWSGSGPYPSVKLRMDFRGPVAGDFVYHCHILGHEDSGMMAIIRVKPR